MGGTDREDKSQLASAATVQDRPGATPEGKAAARPSSTDPTVNARPSPALDHTVEAKPAGLDHTVAAKPSQGIAHTLTVSADGGPHLPAVRPPSPFEASSTRFEEQGELGRGGMGRVADAFDRSLSRQVAIKYVLSTDPSAVARFEREARITAQLEHPGIVPLYETGRNPDGTPYYVMRRVDGKPLDKLVQSGSLADRLALVPNMLAVCDAVAYAHARSIIHRDIKPSNILVGPFGETLLIDWGLARTLADRDDGEHGTSSEPGITRIGAVAGTPSFMPPEQARGEPVDTRADVFALGATMFYVLAGVPPHNAPSATEVIARVAADRTPDWRQFPEGVPEDLRTIVEKALASAASERYADAGALAADLRRFVTGKLVAAHHYGTLEQLRRFVRRHRAAMTVTGISLVLIAAIVVFAFRSILAERDDANRARKREAERADDLTIAQAGMLLDTNPTLALAVVKPLAGGDRWREVRNVLAAATARGVAWHLPSSAGTTRIGSSPDGVHGYSIGTDGVIRLYDLRARTARTVFELGHAVKPGDPVSAELVDNDRFAVFDGLKLTLIDLSSPARHEIPLPAAVTSTTTSAGDIYWIAADHLAWRLPRNTTVPAPIPIDDQVKHLWPSPDGARLVVGGKSATWLVDASGTTQLLPEAVHGVAWDDASTDLWIVTFSEGRIRKGHLTTPPTWDDDVGRGWPERMISLQGRLLIQSTTTQSVGRDHFEGIGLGVAGGDLIVSATHDGHLDVTEGDRHSRLFAPDARIDLLVSSPASHLVLTLDGSSLLLWDLDAVFPRWVSKTNPLLQPQSAGSHYLMIAAKGPATWFDLQRFTTSPGPEHTFAFKAQFVAAPAGSRVLGLIEGHARAFRANTTEDTEVAHDVTMATFLDDHRVAMLFEHGSVEVHDLDAHTRTVAIGDQTKGNVLYANGDHVAVIRGDSTIVRASIANPRGQTQELHDNARFAYLAQDGRMWLVHGATLDCWGLDERVTPHVTLPQPIRSLFVIDDHHLALDTDQVGYLVDLDVPMVARPTIHLGTEPFVDGMFMSPGSGRSIGVVALPGLKGGAQIVDGVTGQSWPVGQAGSKLTQMMFARDGTALFENRGDQLAVFPFERPQSASDTARAVEAATNATVDSAGQALRWPSANDTSPGRD